MFEKSQFDPSCDTSESDEGLVGFGEFVVSCGDASELLEVCEGIFDGMSVSVNALAEGSGAATVGLGRDNGCGPDLLHNILNDGVTVVSLVRQNGDRSRAIVVSQQSLGLRAIMDLAAGEDEVDGPPGGISEQVNFGGQAATRSPQGLIVTASGASGMLVRPHDSRVDHEHEKRAMTPTQALQDKSPKPTADPRAEAAIDRLPLAKTLRQRTPRRPVTGHPKHPREHQNVILARTPTAILFCDMTLALPCVNFFKAAIGGEIASCCITPTT